ncbi:hypothetical protein Scep_028479 [Stephania cephalantha]|uniref:Uncharacterized protein n=1 Tax=Stephania cephalantha TaxID=152367 RepID=A0AAP0HLV3_9MAGN
MRADESDRNGVRERGKQQRRRNRAHERGGGQRRQNRTKPRRHGKGAITTSEHGRRRRRPRSGSGADDNLEQGRRDPRCRRRALRRKDRAGESRSTISVEDDGDGGGRERPAAAEKKEILFAQREGRGGSGFYHFGYELGLGLPVFDLQSRAVMSWAWASWAWDVPSPTQQELYDSPLKGEG